MRAKILRTMVNAPWYVRNEDIRRDLGIPRVKEEINKYAEKYKERVATHPNPLATETINTSNMERRLERKYPVDLIKDITYYSKREDGIPLGIVSHMMIKQLKNSSKCPNWTNWECKELNKKKLSLAHKIIRISIILFSSALFFFSFRFFIEGGIEISVKK